LHFKHKSFVIIELIKLLQNTLERVGGNNQVVANSAKSIEKSELTDYEILWLELDYKELFSLFVVKRKIGLLRFLFSLPMKDFTFTVDLFLRALELEAIDIAALIYREFFRLIRDVSPHDEELIMTSLISSFSKSNGMLEFKCFLVR
jgi:hypothetical protein